MRALKSRQRGFSIIIATFVLVVLGLLAAAMLNLLGAGAESVAREVISTRALLAAESGVQRRLNEVFVGSGSCAACSAGATQSNYANWYDSCAATVACCTRSPGDGRSYYFFTATGRCGPAGEQAVRVIEVQARD